MDTINNLLYEKLDGILQVVLDKAIRRILCKRKQLLPP